MKKIFFAIVLCLVFGTIPAFADNVSADKTVKSDSGQILAKIKYYKNSIYSSLDLTAEQREQINQLDEKLYKNIEPDLEKTAVLSNRIADIANSDNCTKQAVNKVKKEFKPVQKSMMSSRKAYEKELFVVLTKEQKTKYREAKKLQRAEFKKEMQEQKLLHQKNIKQTKS